MNLKLKNAIKEVSKTVENEDQLTRDIHKFLKRGEVKKGNVHIACKNKNFLKNLYQWKFENVFSYF